MGKYRNKYRIESHRLHNWDYSVEGLYFITLVTKNRECNLGEIINGNMILSDWGHIIDQAWVNSFEIRNELFCDEYVVMPNHLHAIVVLDHSNQESVKTHAIEIDPVETHGRASHYKNHKPKQTHGIENNPVETHGRASLQQRQPRSISSFIAGFKSAVNSKIDDFIDENNLAIPKYNRENHFFQSNYHDRIIRSQQEYNRIKKYIINNPSNWSEDSFH